MPLIGLIIVHALITMAYAALTNSRSLLQREQSETTSDTPPRLHITYQLSLLLVRFAIAALSVMTIGKGLREALPIASPLVIYSLALLPTALVTLMLGELVPEAIGSTRADVLAPWAAYLMRGLVILFSPLVSTMIVLSKWLAGIFGSSDKVNVFTEEEILTMLDASEKEGAIENEEKEMIFSVLEFGDRLAREVMIPRIDIVAVEINTPLNEALKMFIEHGHSRIPVYQDNIDTIQGLLYAKDMLNTMNTQAGKSVRDIMRKPFFVPESKRADLLLKELQQHKIHMAVVVDEYGGTAGLVTFEDLIEEIIGDIQDEYDLHEEAEYVQQGPNVYVVDASMSLNDFNDLLEVELSTEDNDTLGGFLFTQLGHVPEVGETVEHAHLTLRVDSLDGPRIRKVHVTRRLPPPVNEEQPLVNSDHTPQAQPVTE